MRKLLLLSIVILSLFLFTGCLAQFDVTQLDQVQDFLKEHPDAEIRVNLWDEATVAANAALILEACQQQLPAKKYWYVSIEEKGTSVKMWVDRDSQEVVCAFREGKGVSGKVAVDEDKEDYENETDDEREDELGETDNKTDEEEKEYDTEEKERTQSSYDTCMVNGDAEKVTLGLDENGVPLEHHFAEVPDFARMIKVEVGNKIYFGETAIEIVAVSDDEIGFRVVGNEEVITIPANVKTTVTVDGLKIKFGYRVEWNGIRAFYVVRCD